MLALLLALQVGLSGDVLPKYECNGTGYSGEYKYTLTIEKQGDNYFLRWGNDYEGMGFLQGNRLAVVYISGHLVGVMLYEVWPGRLVGSWAGGDGKVYKENCTVGIQARR